MAGYMIKPGTTAEDLAEARQFNERLLAQAASTKPLQHWTQVLAQLAQGGLGGYGAYEAETEGRRQQDEASSLFGRALDAMTGGTAGTAGAGAPGAPAATPAAPMPASPATAAAAAAGRDIAPTMGAGGGLLDLTRAEEGFAPQAKWDYRQYSGGYGSKASPGETFTREKAEQYLQRDAAPVVSWVEKNVPNGTPDQKRALVSFGYNLGTDDLDKLKPDIDRGDWARVGQRMLSFNKAGGEVLSGLVDRRRREAALVTGGGGAGAPVAAAASPGMGDIAAERSGRLQAARELYRNPQTRPLAAAIMTAEMTRQRGKPEVVSIELGNGQKRSMLQMPDGSLRNIPAGAIPEGAGGAPPSFDDSSKLRKELMDQPNVKKYGGSIGVYNSMVRSAGLDTRAADLDLVNAFAKIMDPDSAIREGEFAVVAAAQSIPDRIKGQIQYFAEGKGNLTPEAKRKLIEVAGNRVGSYRDLADKDVSRFERIGSRFGIGKEFIAPEFDPLERYAPPAAPAGGASDQPVIKMEWGPNGKLRRAQ